MNLRRKKNSLKQNESYSYDKGLKIGLLPCFSLTEDDLVLPNLWEQEFKLEKLFYF